MPRKGTVPKIEVVADPLYDSTLVTKFINSMMWDGKRSTAQGIFYEAMKKLEEKGGGEGALKLFTKAVENAKPMLEVKTRRGAAPTTRCRWKCMPTGERRWPSAGCSATAGAGLRRA